MDEIKVFGKISQNILLLLVGMIKFYLEKETKKEIIVQSDGKKIIFTEEKNQPGLCGLYVTLTYPYTNIREEVLVFLIDDLLNEKYPGVCDKLLNIISTQDFHLNQPNA